MTPEGSAAPQAVLLELRLVEDLLSRCEQSERAILTELGCPADPAAIDDILSGRMPAPWPTKTAPRDRHRAKLAMLAVVHIRRVRSYLSLCDGNPRLAAHAALLAGLLVNESTAAAIRQRRALGAADTRGAHATAQSRAHDQLIWKLEDEWLSKERREPKDHWIAKQLQIRPKKQKRKPIHKSPRTILRSLSRRPKKA